MQDTNFLLQSLTHPFQYREKETQRVIRWNLKQSYALQKSLIEKDYREQIGRTWKYES